MSVRMVEKEDVHLLRAKFLQDEGEVAFAHNKMLYRITSHTDGWNIDVFDIYNGMEIDDGGICTGSAYDAVKFMLPGEEGVN